MTKRIFKPCLICSKRAQPSARFPTGKIDEHYLAEHEGICGPCVRDGWSFNAGGHITQDGIDMSESMSRKSHRIAQYIKGVDKSQRGQS